MDSKTNVISFTGHRPEKVGGYIVPNPTSLRICDEIYYRLLEIKPSLVLTGMALGVDTWAAWICVSLGIPFVAVIPFKGQESKWNEKDKKVYFELLEQASEVKYISEPGYAAWKMYKRSMWMVDNSNGMIAVYDGSLGGTHNCVQYAKRKDREVFLIKP